MARTLHGLPGWHSRALDTLARKIGKNGKTEEALQVPEFPEAQD